MLVSAIVAFGGVATEGRSSAIDDILDGPFMTGEHVSTELGDIIRPIQPEDVSQFRHGGEWVRDRP